MSKLSKYICSSFQKKHFNKKITREEVEPFDEPSFKTIKRGNISNVLILNIRFFSVCGKI